MQFFRRESARRPLPAEPRQDGAGSIVQALREVADWINDLQRTAGQTADKIAAEAQARSAGGPDLASDEDRLAAALMTALAERALHLKGDADELARLLERAAAQLAPAEEPSGLPQGPAAMISQPPAAPPSQSPLSPAPNRLPKQRDVSEGVRLLTMQMAVAGSSEEEIRNRLRKEFKVEYADEVLEEVLRQP